MFLKKTNKFAVFIQGFLFLSLTVNLSAANFNCGTESVAVCKTKFESSFDEKLKHFTVKNMQKEAADLVKIFNSALKDLPADSANANILEKCIKDIKKDSLELSANMNDYKKMRAINDRIEFNMSPQQTFAPADQKVIVELEKVLNKNGWREKMDYFDSDGFMTAFAKFWHEEYASLREIDRKTYAQYDEVNDVMKIISGTNISAEKKEKAFVDALKKLGKDFNIPLLEEFIFAKGH